MWLARDGDGNLKVWTEYPERDLKYSVWRFNHPSNVMAELNCELFPEVTWSNSPVEVDLIIKKK